jgi:hypothetical protein
MTIITEESIAVTAYTSGLVCVTYDSQLGYNNIITGVQQVVYNPRGTVCVRIRLGSGASMIVDTGSGLLRVCASTISDRAGLLSQSPTSGCEDHNLLAFERLEIEHDARVDTAEVILC